MPQEIAGDRVAVGRHVEELVAGHAGVRARRDVAHRVAAGLARRDAAVGEHPLCQLDLVQLDEMELDVLPRGDVAESA